jgi:HAD superfamily hydrolase (TIGR01509 family)
MSTRAILFDLDGTLVDTERESAEAMARALKAGLGIEISQAERDFIIGRSWVDIYERLRAVYPGLTWTRDQLIAATAEAREAVFAEVGMTILPGAAAVLSRFAHLPLAIVTGSSRVEAAQALAALGAAEAFQAIFASEDVGSSKPAPDGYLAAARALETPPEHCLVVEDSAAGIAAGRAAGCRVVAVRAGNFHGQDQSGAHHIVDSLDELTHDLIDVVHTLSFSPKLS